MSFLHSLVSAMFKGQDVDLHVLPDRDAYRVSVLFTAKDLARYRHDPDGAIRHLSKLRPVRRQRRRLHWGRKR